MAVDWARSCHIGTWRLFKNRPDLLTAGRFYFATDDTPFYPGFHHVYSADWTYDREAQLGPPDLGEDRERRIGYSRGSFGTDLPPPHPLGSRECLEVGEGVPDPAEERTLIMGVDSRCWSAVGEPVPEVGRVLWLTPDRLSSIPVGGLVRRWADRSSLDNPAVLTDGVLTPLRSVSAGLPSLATDSLHYLDASYPVTLGQLAAGFVVATIPEDGSGGPDLVELLGLVGGGPATLTVTADQVVYRDSVNTVTADAVGNYGMLHLWSFRRFRDRVQLFRDGVLLIDQAIDPAGQVTFDRPTATADYGETGLKVQLSEVSIYPGPLSGVAYTAETDRIMFTYDAGEEMIVGAIIDFAGNYTPATYLECDGSAVNRVTYADLFAVIGTTWGPGDGVNTFNLPDLRGRSSVGRQPAALGTDRPDTRAVGAVGGETAHQLTESELAAHHHNTTDGFAFLSADGANVPFGSDLGMTTTNEYTTDAGGDTPHNTMHPFACVRKLIKALPGVVPV